MFCQNYLTGPHQNKSSAWDICLLTIKFSFSRALREHHEYSERVNSVGGREGGGENSYWAANQQLSFFSCPSFLFSFFPSFFPFFLLSFFSSLPPSLPSHGDMREYFTNFKGLLTKVKLHDRNLPWAKYAIVPASTSHPVPYATQERCQPDVCEGLAPNLVSASTSQEWGRKSAIHMQCLLAEPTVIPSWESDQVNSQNNHSRKKRQKVKNEQTLERNGVVPVGNTRGKAPNTLLLRSQDPEQPIPDAEYLWDHFSIITWVNPH